MDDAKEDLKSRCSKLQIELNELQTLLDSTTQNAGLLNQNPSKTLLLERERRMKAEIETLTESLKETDLGLPSHPLLLRELVKEDLKQDTKQLEELLLILRSRCEQLQSDIVDEESMQKSLDCLRVSLENKVRHVEEVQIDVSTEQNSLEDVLDKKAKLERLCINRTQQMTAFIQQHYPPLTKEHVQTWHKKFGKTGSKMPLASSFRSLQNMLELLMSKCITTPDDAYVTTDNSYWPPYIEMMLRCGIVQRHPDNPVKIRLTPFHLR